MSSKIRESEITKAKPSLENKRVRKRGSMSMGRVINVDGDKVYVNWDDGLHAKLRPVFCRPHELEVI